MPSAKSTLGYPSRTAAVHALRAQGLNTGMIARKIGIEPKTVTALEASAARTRDKLRACTDQVRASRSLILPITLEQDLRFHARKRGLSVSRLAIDLLEHIVSDHLVDAVLDDSEPKARP